jgi:trehalose 2-sulfotransferase
MSAEMQPSRSYLVCCCERTGSTLLEEALTDTGVAGRPRSYFNPIASHTARMRRLLKDTSDENYLDRVVVAATTENGVFGAKVHWAHFLNLVSKLDGPSEPAMARLRRHFPDLRYIHLIRKNAVARAISHYRAKKTGLWHRDSAPDDSGGEGEPAFDFDQIENFVRIGETEDATWRQFFAEHHVRPLQLVYEEMVTDLDGTVGSVLAFLDIPAEGIRIKPRLRRQPDHRSREWEERYRRIAAVPFPLAGEG